MECIFCKGDSTHSKSIEHIIPESLGNTEHILIPGIVCDKCNNYFSRKLEQKVLNLPLFISDRHHLSVPSKRGRIPEIKVVNFSGADIYNLGKDKYGSKYIGLPHEKSLPSKLSLVTLAPSSFQISTEGYVSNDIILSRFIAKMALESLYYLTQDIDFIFDDQLDDIRNYARFGGARKSWPIYMRRIYSLDTIHYDEDGGMYEILHEFSFQKAHNNRWMYVIIIFGIEYTISLSGYSD